MRFKGHIPKSLETSNHFRGCLLGGAVGDALGAPVEFISRREILNTYGANGITDFDSFSGVLGAITDDTQMALFTAEGIIQTFIRWKIRGIGGPLPNVLAMAYQRWYQTQTVQYSDFLGTAKPYGLLLNYPELFCRRSPGATCMAVLANQKKYTGFAINESKGCGGVMRVAPIGMFWAGYSKEGLNRLELVFKQGVEAAAITHGHPTGYLTAGVLAVIIAVILSGRDLSSAIDYALKILKTKDNHEETESAIKQAVQAASVCPNSPARLAELGAGWVAEEALAIAIYCALGAKDFESGVLLAVNHDGDSDSTGAIAGNILGAIYGLNNIPERWSSLVELSFLINSISDDLATISEWQISEQNASHDEVNYYWRRYFG